MRLSGGSIALAGIAQRVAGTVKWGDRVQSCGERPGKTVGWVGTLVGSVTEIAIGFAAFCSKELVG